jgi:hypothetical protein
MGVFGRRWWGAGILGVARGARGSDLLLGWFAEFERLEHLVEVVAGCVLIHVLLSLVRFVCPGGPVLAVIVPRMLGFLAVPEAEPWSLMNIIGGLALVTLVVVVIWLIARRSGID